MKYPEKGKVKTRLARGIGQEKALCLYQKLVRRTLGIASDFNMVHNDVYPFLFYYPSEKNAEIRKAYPGPWAFVSQADGHLGDKMGAAFDHVFQKGYGQAVLIGSDIADLLGIDIEEAFEALDEHQAVVGPAQDGGFYLIGLKAPCAKVFNFPSWSNPSVYERTIHCLQDSGLRFKAISKRRDIDQEEDMVHVKDQPIFHDQISIIIPLLGRMARLAPLIEWLEAQLWPGDEIIIVKDRPACHTYETPGSGTVTITSHTRLIFATRGRGSQLNCGSRVAQGNLLWFLHADTVPPPNFGYHIRKLSLAPECALGCFKISLGKRHVLLRLISIWANFRTKYFKLPYGDQGLFCSRHILEKVGGFRKKFLMEDVDLVKACKKMGKLLIIQQELYSSPERYLRKGILRASCQNQLLMLLYFLGVSDRRLYRFYYDSDPH
jgi:rSAM/selenodomain-associated transferase 2/rSAM/selenodomain-associated transferase 1